MKVPERIHTALHNVWTKAVGQENYVKSEWQELDNAIFAEYAVARESERERCAKIAETKEYEYRTESDKAEAIPNAFPNFWAARARAAANIAAAIRQREGGSEITTEGAESSCPHLHQDFPGMVINKCLDCGAPLPESLTPDVQGKLVAEKSPCCGWDVRGEYIVRDKDTLECSRCGQRYVREALALLDGQNQDQKEK